jgi:cytoskeletal protein CcmA (bactofilin family)
MFSRIKLRSSHKFSSIVGPDLIVNGSLTSDGNVQVNGRVDGDIRAASLVVGDKAHIAGDVRAEEAIVRGQIEGGIRARKVQLCSTARVHGNILHEALAMEAGAVFEGHSKHSDDPLGDAPELPAQKPAAKPGATPSAVIAPNIAQHPVGSAQARIAASFTPIKG